VLWRKLEQENIVGLNPSSLSFTFPLTPEAVQKAGLKPSGLIEIFAFGMVTILMEKITTAHRLCGKEANGDGHLKERFIHIHR
jgi:hypothetical protein